MSIPDAEYIGWEESQITSFIELCYHHGVSGSPRLVVPASKVLEDHLVKFAPTETNSSGDLITLLRFGGEWDSRRDSVEVFNSEAARKWLKFYGLMEIAILSNRIPAELPAPFVNESLDELNRYELGVYNEAGFPMTALFLQRLKGHQSFGVQSRDNATRLFEDFLILENDVRDNTSMNSLLGLIGFRTMNEESGIALNELLENPSSLLKIVVGETHTLFGSLIEGAQTSLYFFRDLVDLLEQNRREHPELTASIRHFYSHMVHPLNQRSDGPYARAINGLIDLLNTMRNEVDEETTDQAEECHKEFVTILRKLMDSERYPLPSDWNELLAQGRQEEVLLPV